jgi:hypothetical protein
VVVPRRTSEGPEGEETWAWGGENGDGRERRSWQARCDRANDFGSLAETRSLIGEDAVSVGRFDVAVQSSVTEQM